MVGPAELETQAQGALQEGGRARNVAAVVLTFAVLMGSDEGRAQQLVATVQVRQPC